MIQRLIQSVGIATLVLVLICPAAIGQKTQEKPPAKVETPTAMPTETPEPKKPEEPEPPPPDPAEGLPGNQSKTVALQTLEGETYNLGKQRDWIAISSKVDFAYHGHAKDVKAYICDRCPGDKDPHANPLTEKGALTGDAAAVQGLAQDAANAIAKVTITSPVSTYDADKMGKQIKGGLEDLVKSKKSEVEKRKLTYKPAHWAEKGINTRKIFGAVYQLRVTIQITKHSSLTENNKTTTTDTPLAPISRVIATAWMPLQKPVDGTERPCPTPVPTPSADEGGLPNEEHGSLLPAPHHGAALAVFLVVPADRRPGDLITGRLVERGDRYKSMSGLSVVAVNVPVHEGYHGRAVLHGVVIDTDTAKNQPADGPITMTVPTAPTIPIVVALTDVPTERINLEVPSTPASPKPHRGVGRGERNPTDQKPAMMPVIPDGGVCLIKGKFRGDGGATRVKVNDKPVAVVAESPREVYFQPPANIPTGKNIVTIIEGRKRATFDLFVPKLSIAAGQTVLKQGESTNISVNATGFGGMRSGDWAPGQPSEVTNLAQAERNAPSSTAPGAEGAMLLILQNDSPNAFRLDGAAGNAITKTIHRDDLKNGAVLLDASGTATQPGALELEATLIPLLADAAPTQLEEISGGGEHEGEQEVPPPDNSKQTKEKEEKKDEGKTDDNGKGFQHLKNFFGGNAEELDNPKVQDYLRTREKLKAAKAKEKTARDGSQKKKDAAVAKDPQAKELQGEVTRDTALVNNPLADPEGKHLYQGKLDKAKKDLANAKLSAGQRWDASKEGQAEAKDVHAAESDVRDAQAANDKAGQGLDKDTKSVLDRAQDEAEKNPPGKEGQEKAVEPN